MRYRAFAIALFLGFAAFTLSHNTVLAKSLSASELSAYKKTFTMTWPNGKQGKYTVHSISPTSAKVTYSYGGKSQTKELPVKGNQIVGGGWFPTLKMKGGGAASASHSGAAASVK